MKKCRRVLFAFLAADCQAAQAWLEEQDCRGWELQSLSRGLPTARLVPKTREDIRYCVDLTRGFRDTDLALESDGPLLVRRLAAPPHRPGRDGAPAPDPSGGTGVPAFDPG